MIAAVVGAASDAAIADTTTDTASTGTAIAAVHCGRGG